MLPYSLVRMLNSDSRTQAATADMPTVVCREIAKYLKLKDSNMANNKSITSALTVALILPVAIASCDGTTQPTGLSGTIEVSDFSVGVGETQQVSGDLTINASGSVDIAGKLMPSGATGQSITITAEGDVNVSGSVVAGNGSSGSGGGNLTIISTNGNIVITQGSSIVAGDGSTGQSTTSAKTITEKGTIILKTISGGAGGTGGSITLTALNGDVTIADTEGIIRLGSGGDGATITVSGDDLLTTEAPDTLENAGGDSGDLTIEAGTFNGQAVGAGGAVDLTGTNFLVGGRGGNGGDVFWGMDADGNSTWPDATTTAKFMADAKQAGVNLQAAPSTLIVPGTPGGDAYFQTPGTGASVRAAGQSATTPGAAGQSARAVGGDGGNCKTPICTQGGNGGSATARGGDGAPGKTPDGNGGDGGDANAEGGFRGFGFVANGSSASASAFGGAGGKGGGQCPDEVVDRGGIGGFGGEAFAFAKAGAAQTTAKGGDGGDDQNFSGPGVDGGGGATLAAC